ncbi:MAG: aminotransferase class V-fold PLP-dependent enzyme [Treponema sp.]|nr:aminotransferase class V-fold PLP-dependent enzyme [Treponema sp.]
MNRNMLNFTVGPVMMDDTLRLENSEQIPYFRTPEFSAIMKENESYLCQFLDAPKDSRMIFMTGSGTASMEAAVMNVFTAQDKVLVVNGGSFGHRFVELCTIHGIPFTEIHLNYGEPLTQKHLDAFNNQGYTGLIMQHHETSTGVLYDLSMVGAFCKKNNIFLLVDAISSFMADPLSMQQDAIGAVIMGSQKAMALPPGLSFICATPKAIQRITSHKVSSLYFNLADYLTNGERGQTPFTPAVGTLLLLHTQLKKIAEQGGVATIIKHTQEIAQYFRDGIKDLPLKNYSVSPSNAVTALTSTTGKSAYDIFTEMKDKYQIYICPNGGELKDLIFRVGHIGYITKQALDTLLAALHDMHKHGAL